MVRSGLVLNGMVHGYCLYEVPCKISRSWLEILSSCLEKQLSYGQFKDIWYGLVCFGLVLNGMVHGYCLDVVPCKILISWLEKQQENQQSYG